jgi:hypothetical protein
MHIKSRPAYISAVEDFFNGNEVVVPFVNQRVQRIAQELLRPCDTPVCLLKTWGSLYVALDGHHPLLPAEQNGQNGFGVC